MNNSNQDSLSQFTNISTTNINASNFNFSKNSNTNTSFNNNNNFNKNSNQNLAPSNMIGNISNDKKYQFNNRPLGVKAGLNILSNNINNINTNNGNNKDMNTNEGMKRVPSSQGYKLPNINNSGPRLGMGGLGLGGLGVGSSNLGMGRYKF